jgi:NAD(P)-dependent dehydrogenase (short-subunit alcohol dehydrogenase family)
MPYLSNNSAYSISKLGTARFYEFLAVENPDLNVFILQPGVIRTALYEKGKLELDATIDTSEFDLLEISMLTVLKANDSQLNYQLISRFGWPVPKPNHFPDVSCSPIGM